MKTFEQYENVENFKNKDSYTKEDLINFAKFCLAQADGYTSAGCEEIGWVMTEINNGEIFDIYEKRGGFDEDNYKDRYGEEPSQIKLPEEKPEKEKRKPWKWII